MPSTLNRNVAASPNAKFGRSTDALAWKRPTAPLNPGSSGIGFTSIVTVLVARCTVPPLSKKPCGAIPMLSVAAGIVRRPALVGNSSFFITAKRWYGTPSTVVGSSAGWPCWVRSSAQKPVNSGAPANWSPLTEVCV